MDKSLKEKAISIKGKAYVLVADRVNYFNNEYPAGAIQTELIDNPDRVIFKAKVTPDTEKPDRFFTGYSQAVWGDGYINKSSALENAETSAVGRALALMGIGVIDSIASVDEINKAQDNELVQIGFCNVCGEQGIKAKTKQGQIFYTCPNWKEHKDKGEKSELVQWEVEHTKEEQDFLNSLPE